VNLLDQARKFCPGGPEMVLLSAKIISLLMKICGFRSVPATG
jgi:hypothetical protein